MTDARAPVPLATLLEHRGFVRSLARSLVADAARADDVEQQVWTDAVRSPPAEDRGVRGWLARVVRRRARDQRRGERRFADAVGRAAFERSSPPADEVVAQAETAERLVRDVLSLDEPYRTTLLLRFYEDLAPDDVAQRMGVPPETVRTRTRRGLDRLRARLGGDDPRGREKWFPAVATLAVGDGWGDGRGAGEEAVRRTPRTGTGIGVTSLGGGALMAGASTFAIVAVTALGVGGVVGWTIRGESAERGAAETAAPAVARDGGSDRATPQRAATPTDAAPSEPTAPSVAPSAPAAPAVKPIRGRVVTVNGEHVAGALVWAVAREGGPLGRITESPVEQRNTVFAAYVPTLRDAKLRSSIEARTASDGTFEIACTEDSPHAVWAFPSVAQVRSPTTFAADSVAPGDTIEFVVLPTGADQLRARLIDPRLSMKERIEAFSKLERRGPLDDEAIRAVIELLRAAPEARDRATILRELHGKKSALLVDPLLTYLRDDPDENVREEAAETLDDFLAEPRVVEALTLAKDSDPSDRVRRQAAESLEGGERKGR